MSTAANPMHRIVLSDEDLKLKKFLIYSLILHGLLVLSLALSIYVKFQGEEWSGIGGTEGGAVNVKLSGPPPGIPLPPKPYVPESTAVDPTMGLFKEEEPAPKPLPIPEPVKPAEKIPEFKHEKPLPPTHKSKIDPPKNPAPDNAVKVGKSGPPPLPSSYSNQPPGSGSSPVTVQGPGGGGDFASRYAWYIESVRRRISQNWLQTSIDPAVRAARQAHAIVTFTINRDGSVRNVQLAQSSGNLSMDNSARRALEGIQFGPLPNDFVGSYVDVTFDFDLSLTH
ncbi:MAG TPA: energy transducer TonB [Candidatus Acidoferrum sp.]|jgi:protein TonB